ncbi:FMN-dependent dehydrogenase-domain-containing protein [Schizophyllum fasciatum]
MPYTLEQVSEHKTKNSCWVIINDYVYDVTEFLQEHPGGPAIILKYAGHDATQVYEPIHPRDALEKNLPPSKHLGPVDAEAANALKSAKSSRKKTKDEIRSAQAHRWKPPLSHILSLHDMEEVALKVLSHKARTYYSSSADDEVSHASNAQAFARFFFHPRVLRPVSHCDPSTTILGHPSSLPIFVSGAGLARLGHPLGEANITRGCAAGGIIQMVSSSPSLSYSEIMDAAAPGQTLFFQLYKNRDDCLAEQRVWEVERLGYKAIFLTVDAVVPSKRERDIRSAWDLEEEERGGPLEYVEEPQDEAAHGWGAGGALVLNDDKDMTWEKARTFDAVLKRHQTIPWLRRITKLPVVIKGIQCVEDALLAVQAGVDGILLSNHGGRQLDYALPPLEILYRLRLQHPGVFDRVEVYLDGGVRRGTDVIKAVCLGATAVGLGRPFLYAQSAYGAAGVQRIIHLLKNEIVTAMRLMGASGVEDLKPNMVERVDWQPVQARL